MTTIIKHEPENIYLLRFSGIVKQAEFAEKQDILAHEIDTGAQPRLLVILEDFGGWEKNADWSDLGFLFSHSAEIARIAIVGEPRWQTQALAFAGAGFRRAPVKFFPTGQETEARTWLTEA